MKLINIKGFLSENKFSFNHSNSLVKIHYITQARIPTQKAHGFQIAKMCEAYAGFGHEVQLVIPYRKSNNVTDDTYSYYGVKKSFTIKKIKSVDWIRFSYILGRFAYHMQTFFFLGTLFFYPIAKEKSIIYTRTPVIAWFYTMRNYTVVIEVHDWPNSFQRMFCRMLRNMTLIVANSNGIQEEFEKQGIYNVLIAPNGVDIESLQPTRSRQEMRNQYSIRETDYVIMYIGALEKWKGVQTLLDISKKLPKGHKVVVAGGSKKEISSLQHRYSHVMFLGQTDIKELGNYQQIADVLVVPNDPADKQSEKYTSPIKLFAYMTSGIPIIVTNLPSMQAVVSDDEVFFFDGTPESLLQTVSKVKKQKLEIKEKTKNARELVAKYSWKARAQCILSEFCK